MRLKPYIRYNPESKSKGKVGLTLSYKTFDLFVGFYGIGLMILAHFLMESKFHLTLAFFFWIFECVLITYKLNKAKNRNEV